MQIGTSMLHVTYMDLFRVTNIKKSIISGLVINARKNKNTTATAAKISTSIIML